jgi:preprotein translocase subunit SecA
MKFDLADCVQRGHNFCTVDEVDSILIDEARTPLIISGPAEESTDKYYRIDKIIPKLIQEIDYTVDESTAPRPSPEEGVSKCESFWASAICTIRSTWRRFTTSTRAFARTRSTNGTSSTS